MAVRDACAAWCQLPEAKSAGDVRYSIDDASTVGSEDEGLVSSMAASTCDLSDDEVKRAKSICAVAEFQHVAVSIPELQDGLFEVALSGFELRYLDKHKRSPLYMFAIDNKDLQTNQSVVQVDAIETPCGLDHVLAAGESQRHTTLTVRGLPRRWTQSMILDLLDRHGFAGLYDFVYLPFDFGRLESRGYAFVNTVTPEAARSLVQRLWGYTDPTVNSARTLTFCWSDLQGLDEHIKRYKDSAIMHVAVPNEYKPCLMRGGVQMPFPKPSKRIRPPQGWRPNGKHSVKCETVP